MDGDIINLQDLFDEKIEVPLYENFTLKHVESLSNLANDTVDMYVKLDVPREKLSDELRQYLTEVFTKNITLHNSDNLSFELVRDLLVVKAVGKIEAIKNSKKN